MTKRSRPTTPAAFDRAVQQTLPDVAPPTPPYHAPVDETSPSPSCEPLALDIVAPAPASEAPAPAQTDTESAPSQAESLAQPQLGIKGKKTPAEQQLALIAAVQSGLGARAAASQVGLNLRTAYNVLASMEDDTEALRAATQRLMALGSVDAIDQWRVAMDVGARKKGNHAPARDWLLHAGVIDALATDSSVNVRVAICIGTDEKPMRIVSPLQVPRTQDDSADD